MACSTATNGHHQEVASLSQARQTRDERPDCLHGRGLRQRAVDLQSFCICLGRTGDGRKPNQSRGQEFHCQHAVGWDAPLDLHQPIRIDPDLRIWQLVLAHEEECHRAQRLDLYARLISIIVGQTVQIAQPIRNLIESEPPDPRYDPLVLSRNGDLATP